VPVSDGDMVVVAVAFGVADELLAGVALVAAGELLAGVALPVGDADTRFVARPDTGVASFAASSMAVTRNPNAPSARPLTSNVAL